MSFTRFGSVPTCPPPHRPRPSTASHGARIRLSRDEVVSHQRERLLSAVTAAVAAKGYGPTTIGDITRRARVSRDTFYEQFASKEQCFLAAYDEMTSALLAEIVAVGTSQADYVDGIREGIRAYLKFWNEHHDAARAFMIDILAAGETAHAHRDRILDGVDPRLFKPRSPPAWRPSRAACPPSQPSCREPSSSRPSTSQRSASATVERVRCPSSRLTWSTYGSWDLPDTRPRPPQSRAEDVRPPSTHPPGECSWWRGRRASPSRPASFHVYFSCCVGPIASSATEAGVHGSVIHSFFERRCVWSS